MLTTKFLNGELLNTRMNAVLSKNSGSIIRTIIYTIAHFIIAATSVCYFTGTNFVAAMTDAIVEPFLNAIWYFVLDRYWVNKIDKNKINISKLLIYIIQNK
tara:strand:+ start:1653 stop:1955 length:303 start_codon:yes stop_codon:yes gene_type:complete